MKKDNTTLFHFCTQNQWKEQEEEAVYEDPSLKTEGFIHCSTDNQVQKVLNRYFQGKKDILMLHIDPEVLESSLQYERAANDGDFYPHIYGPINKSAIIKIESVL